MDRLPPEVLSKIFPLVCTDGGTTGRSLALVSRYIREVSEPYQLQSVAINNAADAVGFVRRLGCASDREIRVKDLYFSNKMTSTAFIYEDERRQAPPPKDSFLKRTLTRPFSTSIPNDVSSNSFRSRNSLDSAKQQTCSRIQNIGKVTRGQDKDLMYTLTDILRTISSTLHTLTIDLTRMGYMPCPMPFEVSAFELPALRCLTVGTSRTTLFTAANFHAPTLLSTSLCFSPRPKYLDLVDSSLPRSEGWLKELFRDLGHSLTHMRLDGRAALSLKADFMADPDAGVAQEKLPPALERVFIQTQMFSRVELDSGWDFDRDWKPEALRLEADPSYKIVVLYVDDAETPIEELAARWS